MRTRKTTRQARTDLSTLMTDLGSVVSMGKETWTKDEIETLEKDFFNYTLKELKKQFPKHSEFGIRNKALRLGMKKDRSKVAQEQRKYNVNLDFFKTFNSESCYWLGFISADGCIYYDKLNSRYGLAFTQNIKDKAHIIKLHKILSGSPITITKDGKVNYRCISKELSEILIRQGIKPKKSLTNTYPKKIPSKFHNDFIRGYIDGDGTVRIGLTKQGKLKLIISMVGTKQFLDKVKEIIDGYDFGMDVNIHKDRPEKALCVLTYQHKDNILNLAKWLYPKDCFALERKKNPIYEYAKTKGVEI